MPLLGALFTATGIIGGYLVGVVMIGVDPGPVSYTHLTLPTSDLV